eukprot:2253572-Prymnesium_polylepis.1
MPHGAVASSLCACWSVAGKGFDASGSYGHARRARGVGYIAVRLRVGRPSPNLRSFLRAPSARSRLRTHPCGAGMGMLSALIAGGP